MYYRQIMWSFVWAFSLVLLLISCMVWAISLRMPNPKLWDLWLPLSCFALFMFAMKKNEDVSSFLFQVHCAFGVDFFTPFPKLFFYKRRWIRQNTPRLQNLLHDEYSKLRELCLHKDITQFRDIEYGTRMSELTQKDIAFRKYEIATQKELAVKLGFDKSLLEKVNENELVFQ